MTRLQRGYVAMAAVGFILAFLYAWGEREYTLCGLRDPSTTQRVACRENPVLDATEFATDLGVGLGWVALIMFLIWLMLWVLRGK
jgi:hypothetical protein